MVYELADGDRHARLARAAESANRAHGETAGRRGQPTRPAEAAGTRARKVFDGRHDRENDRYGKGNRKAAKTNRGTMSHALILSRAPLYRALPGAVWSVEDVHAPFDHFDGNSHSDGESKKAERAQ